MSYENAYSIGYTARAKQKDYDPLSNSAICEYIDNAIALDLDLAENKAKVVELEGLLKDAVKILNTPSLHKNWKSFAGDFVLQNKPEAPDTELDKAGDDLLYFGRSFTTVDSEGNVKRVDPKDVYPNPADDRSDK